MPSSEATVSGITCWAWRSARPRWRLLGAASVEPPRPTPASGWSRNRRRPSPTSFDRSEVTRLTPEWRTEARPGSRGPTTAAPASSSAREPPPEGEHEAGADGRAQRHEGRLRVRREDPDPGERGRHGRHERPPHRPEEQRGEHERDRHGQVAAEDRGVVEDRVDAEERAERVRDHQLAVPPDVVAQHLVDADRGERERQRDLHAQEAGEPRPRRRMCDERRQQQAERQRVERERLGALGRARAPGERRGFPRDQQQQREREAPRWQREPAPRRAAPRATSAIHATPITA